MHSVWRKLSPKDFESFCAALLGFEKFKNITWLGAAGGNKARDILAQKTIEPIAGKEETQQWVIQCKHYSKKRLSKAELYALFASAEEHHPDNLLLVYTNALSGNIQDWIRSIAPNYTFRIYVWQITDLESLLKKHYLKLSCRFPKQFEKQNSLWIYHLSPPDEHEFLCHEFEEISIKVINSGTFSNARRRALEFIEHIRSGKITFSRKPAPNYHDPDS